MDIRTYYEEQRGLMCTAMQESLPYLRRLLRMDAKQFAAVLGIHEQEMADIEVGDEELGATMFLAIAAVLDGAVRERPEIAVRMETILSLNAPEDAGLFDHLGTLSLTQRWLDTFPAPLDIYAQDSPRDWLTEEDYHAFATDCRIFLDHSVVASEGFFAAAEPLIAALREHGSAFFISLATVRALEGDMRSTDDAVRRRAKHGMQHLVQLQEEGLIDLRGEDDDGSELSTFFSVFARFKNAHQIVLFTNTSDCAAQIALLNRAHLGGAEIDLVGYQTDHGFYRWQVSGADCGIPSYADEEDDADVREPVIGWDDLDGVPAEPSDAPLENLEEIERVPPSAEEIPPCSDEVIIFDEPDAAELETMAADMRAFEKGMIESSAPAAAADDVATAELVDRQCGDNSNDSTPFTPKSSVPEPARSALPRGWDEIG